MYLVVFNLSYYWPDQNRFFLQGYLFSPTLSFWFLHKTSMIIIVLNWIVNYIEMFFLYLFIYFPKRYKLLYFIDNSGSVSYLFINCVQILKVGRQCEMSQIVVILERLHYNYCTAAALMSKLARWLRAVTSLHALPGPASQCQHQRTEPVLTTRIK